MKDFSIGDVAERSKTAASAIRYYERIKLLPPPRRVSGRRRYQPEVLAQLALIQVAKDVGFSLDETRTLLGGVGGKGAFSTRLRQLASDKLPEIEATLQRGRLMKRLLGAATSCQCPDWQTCTQALKKSGLLPS